MWSRAVKFQLKFVKVSYYPTNLTKLNSYKKLRIFVLIIIHINLFYQIVNKL